MRLVPRQLARDQRVLDVDLPLDSFPRLRDAVVDLVGRVRVRVQFDRDDQGRVRIVGRLVAEVCICCGNCRETAPTTLTVDVDSCVVKSEDDARELIADADPLILDEPEVTAADLFEDDLLLALPDRPASHEQGCPAQPAWQDDETPAATRTSPFAVLAGLGSTSQDD